MDIFNQRDVFSLDEFEYILNYYPKMGWEDAVVYNTKEKKEVMNTNTRKAKKQKEKDYVFLLEVKKLVMKILIPWFRKTNKDFRYLYFRIHESQWLLYEKDMFFKKHQDFERYICDEIVPYTCLIGLEDTWIGGETVVEEISFKESTVKNGMLCFPSNKMHEGLKVQKGVKKCLKLEFLAFYYQESALMICDDKNHWKSYWSEEFISNIPNFVQCFRDFQDKSSSTIKKDEKKIIVSEDMAKIIYDIMAMLGDGKSFKKIEDEEFQMVFPGSSYATIRELLGVVSFQKNEKRKAMIGKNQHAWNFLNESSLLDPQEYSLFIGLWMKSKNQEPYSLIYLCDRDGKEMIWDQQDTTEGDEFVDYDEFTTTLLKKYVQQQEKGNHHTLSSPSKMFLKKTHKGVHHCIKKKNWKTIINTDKILPSDLLNPALYINKKVLRSYYELCNDEESGGEYIHYKKYLNFYLQVRWCIIKNN